MPTTSLEAAYLGNILVTECDMEGMIGICRSYELTEKYVSPDSACFTLPDSSELKFKMLSGSTPSSPKPLICIQSKSGIKSSSKILESLGYHKAKNKSAKDGLTVYEKGSPLSPSTTRCTIHRSSRLLSFTRHKLQD